jgi:hypothetical protein
MDHGDAGLLRTATDLDRFGWSGGRAPGPTGDPPDSAFADFEGDVSRCFDFQGDLQLSDDETRFVLVGGQRRLRQRLQIGMQRLKGTWRWDRSLGLPLAEIEKLTESLLRSLLRSYLLSYPEVKRVKTLDVKPDPDEPSLGLVSYVVVTDEGEIDDSNIPFLVVS